MTRSGALFKSARSTAALVNSDTWRPSAAVALWVAITVLVCSSSSSKVSASSVVQLSAENLQQVVDGHHLVFVMFYADWCYYSNLLEPTFADAASEIAKLYPEPGTAILGKVDCDANGMLCDSLKVTKYPTLKIYLYGLIVWREYRGERSRDALVDYIRLQLTDPVIEKPRLEDTYRASGDFRLMNLFVASNDSEHYRTVRQVASHFRGDCLWWAVIGDASLPERRDGDVLYFRRELSTERDEPFTNLSNRSELMAFAHSRCVPLVKELTFENAEELSEENIPFLILFRDPDDVEVKGHFRAAVAREIADLQDSVMALTADGHKFVHPLRHLGKAPGDLPVLVIDTFRHMFVFKGDVVDALRSPGVLKQFIDDLLSEKLHRDYHAELEAAVVPPSVPATAAALPTDTAFAGAALGGSGPDEHLPRDKTSDAPAANVPGSAGSNSQVTETTGIPESKFRNLRPSRRRYSLLKEEL